MHFVYIHFLLVTFTLRTYTLFTHNLLTHTVFTYTLLHTLCYTQFAAYFHAVCPNNSGFLFYTGLLAQFTGVRMCMLERWLLLTGMKGTWSVCALSLIPLHICVPCYNQDCPLGLLWHGHIQAKRLQFVRLQMGKNSRSWKPMWFWIFTLLVDSYINRRMKFGLQLYVTVCDGIDYFSCNSFQ